MDPRLRILLLVILIVLLAAIALAVIVLLMMAWRRSLRLQQNVEAKHQQHGRNPDTPASIDAWSEAGRRMRQPFDDDEDVEE